MANIVMLFVDQRFTLNSDDQCSDLWIVDSAENFLKATELRYSKKFKSVTTFRDRGCTVTTVISILPAVFEHHPDAAFVIVRGLKANEYVDVLNATPECWTGAILDDSVTFRPITIQS